MNELLIIVASIWLGGLIISQFWNWYENRKKCKHNEGYEMKFGNNDIVEPYCKKCNKTFNECYNEL